MFDSYYQRPEWWQAKFRSLPSGNPKIAFGKELLGQVTSYMAAWRPPGITDFNKLYACAETIHDKLSQLRLFEPINPIIKIVAYDYLGLACQKVGIREKSDQTERLEYLDRSKEALKIALELAKVHDDPVLPLWQGYASFNLAKTLHEIDQLIPTKQSDNDWRKMFHDAITIRENWKIHTKGFPIDIKEGLITECLHAKAERILRVRVDNNNSIAENFPNATDEEYIEKAEKEYHEWQTDPDHIRVRLATNLNESWGKIKERFQDNSQGKE